MVGRDDELLLKDEDDGPPWDVDDTWEDDYKWDADTVEELAWQAEELDKYEKS